MLSWALDSAAEARLIVAADGRIGLCQRALSTRLFPGPGRRRSNRIRRALCSRRRIRTAQFRRLRGRAAAGARRRPTLSLSRGVDWRSRPVRRSGWTRSPATRDIVYWRIWDVSARISPRRRSGRSGTQLSRPGRQCADRILLGRRHRAASASSTGHWRDGSAARLPRSLPRGLRLHDFLASPAAAGTPRFEPVSCAGCAAQRGEIVLKTRQGRIMPAWIGQNVVGSGSAAAHAVGGMRFDAGTRVEGCAQIIRTLSALFRQCARRDCLARSARAIRGGEPSGRRAVRRRAAKPERAELIDLLNEEDRERIAAKLAAAAEGPRASPSRWRSGRSGRAIEPWFLFLSRLDDPADGRHRRDAGGRPTRATGLTLHFIDVTEQKNLEIQFAQSQKMQAIGQLAGGVAHDFNNLLTAMIGFCDLLLLRSPPSDPSFADIMQIKQNANRAANLVRQLLAFSRQQTLQPRVLNITDVLYELRHLIERLIGENIELEVVHGRDLGLVKVDQGQFEQVIINLAVNARDAMPDGGTLTIRTANVRQERELRRGHEVMPAGDYVLIEMTDTGVGIPKENLARIFDPFFSTKELGSGNRSGFVDGLRHRQADRRLCFRRAALPARARHFRYICRAVESADAAAARPVEIAEAAHGKGFDRARYHHARRG